jgi:hypothetical protein
MSNIVLNIAYYFFLFERMLMNTFMESNRQLPTSYIYVETKRRLFEDKTSLNDCMLTIFDYDKIFQWMDGWVGGRMD